MSTVSFGSSAIQIVPASRPQSGPKTAEQIDNMSPAERFEYCRQFDQSKMPEWKDPRSA